MTSPVVVAGTDTGVGKTIVAAAICASVVRRGLTATYVKAAQSGIGPGEPTDCDVVAALAGPSEALQCAAYEPPLAPGSAIRLGLDEAVPLAACVEAVRDAASISDVAVVEGAGGLLVDLDGTGATIADLAKALGAAVVIVARPDLGTLNHTALTLEAAAARDVTVAGIVVGSWPREPDLACRSNIGELRLLAGQPVAGVVPDHAGALAPSAFRRAAPGWLAPHLWGDFDGRYFELSLGLPPPDGREETTDG